MSAFRPESYAEALSLAQNRPRTIRTPLRPGKAIQTRPAAAKARKTARKKKAKRAKVPTRKKLIKTIDNLVFQIVCLMYPGCVECGSTDQPTTGHVLSRRSFATRWDFRNVFRQCWSHNYRAAMTAAGAYHLWYVKTYGIEAFEKLYQDWAKGHKYTRLELQNLVPEFESKLNELQNGDKS